MQGKVSRKSQYGFQVEGKDGWISYGKYYKGTKDFELDSTVEYDVKVNGEFTNLVSLTVVNTPTAQTTATVSKDAPAKATRYSSEDKTQMARSTAVKAVFASPTLADQYKNLDVNEAVSNLKSLSTEVTNYILTGKFGISAVNENTEEGVK